MTTEATRSINDKLDATLSRRNLIEIEFASVESAFATLVDELRATVGKPCPILSRSPPEPTA
jgi:hypothetical protein